MNPYLVSWLRFNDENDIAKDECGNTWTVSGSPTLTTDNAILGKACYISTDAQLRLPNDSIIFSGEDFSVDAYITMLSGATPLTIHTTNNFYQFTFSSSNKSMKLHSSDWGNWYFPRNSIQFGERHHYAWSYTHHDNMHYWVLDGTIVQTNPGTPPGRIRSVNLRGSSATCNIDEFRIFDGIALWTEPFTPPTTEADYDLTECPFSIYMPATRSIIKPIDESAAIKRTVDKTTDESANLSSRAVRSENLFQAVTRLVDKTADESANIKREVRVSTINDIAPIRRTVNVADNFANVKRSTVATKENFSVTNRGVVFSKDYEFQPQRRLLNLADEFAHLRRSVHEPQVVDIYTRRRLVNIADSFSTTQRRVLFSGDNLINSIRRAVCSTENFSPTSRAVIKSAEEFSSTKRRILFSADNDCPNICRLINNSDNFAPVTSRLVFSDIFFANTFRHAMWSEDYYVPLFSHVWKTEEISLPVKATITFETEISAPLSLAVNKSDEVFADTLRRSSPLSLIITLKSPQGETLGRVRFLPYKNSSIGHLCTRFHGSIFYAGLVNLYSPLASNIHIMKNGITYAVMQS